MSLEIAWDYPALAIFFRLPRRVAEDVDRAVQEFTRERAPEVPSGRRRIRVTGYEIAVRVDLRLGTVLVLHIYRIT
jgi:hypothetical protein